MSQRRKRILVADDHPAVTAVVRYNLERAGYDVVSAHDGAQAWELISAEPFDLIIVDHQMPHITGSELCLRMRQNRQHQQTPVIMLTGKGLELDAPELEEELGVALIMAKPFSPHALTEAVREHFATCALRSG